MKIVKIFIATLLIFSATLLFAQDCIEFQFEVDDKPLVLNEIRYLSERKIAYEVCQCQYFLSHFAVKNHNGNTVFAENSVHYIDAEIKSTLRYNLPNNLSIENVDTLIFTFGLDSLENRSYRFRNPPENLMFWPEYLGGGYHYMKTNIRYIAPDGSISAFNCHIGRGQVYNADGEPISYIENNFEVRIPLRKKNEHCAIVTLDIGKLFNSPNKSYFPDYRGIMNNQQAMSMFCENLKEAFK